MNHFEQSFSQIFSPCRNTVAELERDNAPDGEYPSEQKLIKGVLTRANRKELVIEALSETSILSDKLITEMNRDGVGLLLIAEAAINKDPKHVEALFGIYLQEAGTSIGEIIIESLREYALNVAEGGRP